MIYDRLSTSAHVLADSTNMGSRLVTFEATFPRFILAEFNTHRILSKNSASSRAIPVWKRLSDVISHPFVPMQFGKNKAGMQSREEISEEDAKAARENWLVCRDVAVLQSFILAGGEAQVIKDSKGDARANDICAWVKEKSREYPDVFSRMKSLSVGVHKQHANRLIEPYAWHTVIVTGTCWRNFYALRASPLAQPEIQSVAIEMARAHMNSTSQELLPGEWHLPLIFSEDRSEVTDSIDLARISSGRCARVSYLTHDGKRRIDSDLELSRDLQGNGHMSPFEHPAMARTKEISTDSISNFGNKWLQLRKMLSNEKDFSRLITTESLLEGMRGDQALVDFVLSLSE